MNLIDSTSCAPVPLLAYPGGGGSAEMYRAAAARLEDGYDIGGKGMRAAAAQLMRNAADALERDTTDVEWHLELFVPGRAAPQGSKQARPIYRGKGATREFTGKVATVESSKAGVNAWRGDVRAALIPAWDGRPPLDGPLVLEVEFIRNRPKSAPKSYTPEHTTYPDVSKLVRSTEDAITSAGVWADDARVVRLIASKRNAEHGETAGAHIRIGRLTPAREKWEATKRKPSDRFSGPEPGSPGGDSGETPFVSEPHSQPGKRTDSGAPPPHPTPKPGQNGTPTPETTDLLEDLMQSIARRTR